MPILTDRVLKARVTRMLEETITALAQKPRKRPSEHALLGFLVRGAGTWKSINYLINATNHSQDDADAISNDCGALLRCLYDAFIQAGYVFAVPKEREARGELFLNYYAIERHQRSQEVVKLKTPFAKKIAQSPMRAAGEKRNKREYDRVKHLYLNKSKKNKKEKVRDHWYPGTLRDRSQDVGCLNEYISFVKSLNGSTHSGPAAIRHGCSINNNGLWVWSAMLVSRIAKMVVENSSLAVSERATETIRAFTANSPSDL